MEKYRLFNECIEDLTAAGSPLPSFEEICGRIGVSPRLLENLLFEELGVSGEELLSSYRN